MNTKTIANWLFIAAAGVFLSLPPVMFNWKDAVSTAENRTLAVLPSLCKDGKANKDFFRGCDTFIGDRCGMRKSLSSMIGVFDLFSMLSSNKKVIVGKDDWLFYTDGENNLSDFLKINLLTDKQLAKSISVLEDRKHWCDEQGIKFLVVICPNKHTIYEEYYPFPRPAGITRAQQLTRALRYTDVDFVFPREQLLEAKAQYPAPLYYKTDTHWNNLGAMIASRTVIDKIHGLFPDASFPHLEYTFTFEAIHPVFITGPIQRYDMPGMLGLKTYGIDYEITIKPKGGEWSDYYTYKSFKDRIGQEGIITKGVNPALPKAVIIRDSYTMALEPFLSAQFSKADYRWKKFDNDEKEKLLADKPDIVIFEWVERYTGNLQRL